VPFGQGRLVLLYLATNAIRYKTPTVWFRSGAEILVEWGMPTNGTHYARLLEAFQRVFGSTIFFGGSDEQRETKVWECSHIHFFDSMKLWISNKDGKSGALRDNSVTLSPEFWQELKEHPTPVDAEVVRMLARNPGWLDLYTWLTWRCHQAKRPEQIPQFGRFGLAAQLGVQSYTRRQAIRRATPVISQTVRRSQRRLSVLISENDMAGPILPDSGPVSKSADGEPSPMPYI
jgi:hypothetical protein